MPMNYIDPMEIYRSMPDMGGQLADSIKSQGAIAANLVNALPEARKRDTESMNNRAYKREIYNKAKEVLQSIGIDPATVNIPNPDSDQVDNEKYSEQVANILAPYAEGKGDVLKPEVYKALGMSQNPNVQENLQRQSFLTKYDPMGRIDTSKMQTVQPSQAQPEGQQFGPALPEGSQSSYDPMTGTGVDAMTGQTNVAPQSKAFDVDSTLGMMTPLLVEAVKNKEISPEKATEKILDLKLADQKEKSEERKFWREMFKSGLATRDAVNPETGETETITEDNWNKLGLGKATQKQGGIGAYSMMKRADWVRIHGREPQTPEEWYEVFQTGLSSSGIDRSTQKAGSEATARNLATEKLSDKETTDLESMRTQYANMGNAAKNVSDGYLTPYLGRGIRLAYLRQNDEKFAEFMTPLALALNEYRRENFGTAQTQSEIQNFLDVVNSDLNVTVDVFKAQLNSVLSSIKRDYNDKVTTREQQNKVIPDNLKDIKIQPKTGAKKKRYNPATGAFEVVE